MKRKRDLDVAVAFELGLSPAKVSPITQEFARFLIKHLVEEGEVSYDGLGQFRVYKQRQTMPADFGDKHNRVVGVSMLRVAFSKSSGLRKELAMAEEDIKGMDKFAVDETTAINQEKLEKFAADGCPACGSEVSRHGSVLICPKCGSEPFELKNNGGQEKDDNP